jgi:hypothetical protein
MNDRLKLLAPDLTRAFPRSPRETLAGYVVAARVLDKCRAVLAGTQGEYLFNCPLDQLFFEFTSISAEAFQAQVAAGASDAEMSEWIQRNAAPRAKIEIVRWNNELREKRISQLPEKAQLYLEEYIPRVIPKNRPVYCWFDVYDLEEQRI